MRTNLRYLADIRFLFRMDFGVLAPDPNRTRGSFRLYAALARDDGGHQSGTHYDSFFHAVEVEHLKRQIHRSIHNPKL